MVLFNILFKVIFKQTTATIIINYKQATYLVTRGVCKSSPKQIYCFNFMLQIIYQWKTHITVSLSSFSRCFKLTLWMSLPTFPGQTSNLLCYPRKIYRDKFLSSSIEKFLISFYFQLEKFLVEWWNGFLLVRVRSLRNNSSNLFLQTLAILF